MHSMLRQWSCALLLLLAAAGTVVAEEPQSATHFEDTIRTKLDQYCAACHDPEDPDNHINFLSAYKTEEIQSLRGIWGSVAAQLRNRTMPPPDEDQPTEQERLEMATWIEDHLRQTACQLGPYAGHVTTRRLNRSEYNNTIRDLVGPTFDFHETFPTDGSGGEGFNNNGETLFLPPMLMERYLEAAQTVLNAAIVTPPLSETLAPSQFIPTQATSDQPRTVSPNAEITAGVVVYVVGDYEISVDFANPTDRPGKLVLKLDGLPADRVDVKPKNKSQTFSTTVRLTRGFHAIGLRVPKDQQSLDILRLKVTEKGVSRPENARQFHNRLFQAKDGQYEKTPAAAANIIRDFARRAFRRPVTDSDIAPFLSLFDRAQQRNDPYEECVKLALKGILVSPQFLFRIEASAQSTEIERINDFELASRLSYFLWSSMPDERLFNLARENRLHQANVLQEEVRRMLQDVKAEAFFETFTGQWLGTKEVGGSIAPTAGQFRDVYSNELAADFRAEPIELFKYMVRENRSILEFIDADYAFVNRRLAKHYELQEMDGKQFQKIDVQGQDRGGLLGLGGVHMVTSYPQRTSPVLRGAWVLETLLGTPVPSPPDDIPELPKKPNKKQKLSFRQQLEKHRDNSSCAACHDLIDPIGFGLDNYDIFGRWRDKGADGKPVDATGIMPSGEKFSGPAELKKILLGRKQEFARHLSRKVLGYALGRSLEDRDSCTIENLVTALEANHYQFQTLIQEVVASTPFRFRQQTEPTSHTASH